MKKNLILPLIALAGLFASCDDNTDELGYSITNPTDRMAIDYGTFNVKSETVKLDNIISRSSTGYLGKIKNPWEFLKVNQAMTDYDIRNEVFCNIE